MDLDLLKRELTGMATQDPPIPVPWLPHTDYRESTRATGFDWPQHAPCMIGLHRLGNVQQCVEQVLADRIPGDLAEAGVWRGGTCIFMRALLKLHGVSDREVWVIDSFAGLPGVRTPEQDSLAVSLEEVKRNFGAYGLLDSQVRFLEGWFRDTLPDAPIDLLAVLRIDGDLYESQMDALTYLYPRLSLGGYVIIDDPQFAGCARAIAEYRAKHNIREPVLAVDGYAVFWRKETPVNA